MATSASGATVPAGSDAFDPQGAIVAYDASISDSIIIPVANTTARGALPAALGWTPTTSRPLLVFRADATPGLEHEYTVDGTTWLTIAAANTLLRSGSVAATTDANGDIVVTYATPFPTATTAVTIQDTNINPGIGSIPWKVHTRTTTGFTARAMSQTGSTPIASIGTTFDYIATGN